MKLTRRAFALSCAAMALAGTALAQDVPAGYPADYAATVEAAKSQGKVVIYTSTDIAQAQALLDAFTAKYGIAVEYNDLGTNGAYNRAISEAAASQMGADIVWSSAMDLQMTLAADGYACNALGWRIWPTAIPASCRAASSSASRSAGR